MAKRGAGVRANLQEDILSANGLAIGHRVFWVLARFQSVRILSLLRFLPFLKRAGLRFRRFLQRRCHQVNLFLAAGLGSISTSCLGPNAPRCWLNIKYESSQILRYCCIPATIYSLCLFTTRDSSSSSLLLLHSIPPRLRLGFNKFCSCRSWSGLSKSDIARFCLLYYLKSYFLLLFAKSFFVFTAQCLFK